MRELVSEACLVKADPGLYKAINQGVLDVEDMDDADEMKATDVSAQCNQLISHCDNMNTTCK